LPTKDIKISQSYVYDIAGNVVLTKILLIQSQSIESEISKDSQTNLNWLTCYISKLLRHCITELN